MIFEKDKWFAVHVVRQEHRRSLGQPHEVATLDAVFQRLGRNRRKRAQQGGDDEEGGAHAVHRKRAPGSQP